jgi:hypothetical protein
MIHEHLRMENGPTLLMPVTNAAASVLFMTANEKKYSPLAATRVTEAVVLTCVYGKTMTRQRSVGKRFLRSRVWLRRNWGLYMIHTGIV